MSAELDAVESLSGDAKIVAEAKMRFQHCQDWEGYTRPLNIEDLKFAEGDSDNGYQWPADVSSTRGQRPMLTINKTRQHNLQIINDSKQNQTGIKIRPVGDGATFNAAQTYEGLVRHTEYISNAQDVYDHAISYQVKMGVGYARVITDYEHDRTLNQEAYIRAIPNPLDVYMDPDIEQKDASDAWFAFVFKDKPIDAFRRQHPKFAHLTSIAALDNEDNWITDKHIRIAEYYRKVEIKNILWFVPDPVTGEITPLNKNEIPKEVREAIVKKYGPPEEREVIDHKIEWYLIVGNEIADRKDWIGKTIPIVPLYGERSVIEGVYDRKGHTRALKDAQRMYNYNASAAIEYGALQSKSPWIAPAAAIEGYTEYWANINTENYSVIPYNHIGDDGKEIPAPERVPTPQGAPIYLEAMQTADSQMMMVSGQYEANLGRKSNEVSGKAIDAREHQGDQATQHFNTNQAIFKRRIGKILLEIYPKIYDVERIIKIEAEDGTQSDIKLDPSADQAHQLLHAQQAQEASAIFNPNVGKYDVMVDVAPSYQTRRQEAFNALSQIISGNEQAFMLLGDMWARNSDFPDADKVADRLSHMIPEQAKGGPSPESQQLLAKIQEQQGIIKKLVDQAAISRLEIKGKEADKSVDQYKADTDRIVSMFDAITKRMDSMEKHMLTPKEAAHLAHDGIMQQMALEGQAALSDQTHNQNKEIQSSESPAT